MHHRVIVYIDTSAFLRMVVVGRDAQTVTAGARVRSYLDLFGADDIVLSSALLRTEVRCQANRQPEIDIDLADSTLAEIDIVDIEQDDFANAPLVPGQLRTLDALHLAAALRLRADVMVSLDAELLRAARLAGLRVGP